MDAGGDRTRRRSGAVRGRGRAVQGRAGRHRRRRHLALHAGRLHRPLPRAPPAELVPDQGRQADGARGRVLARRREEHAADPDLRHGVLHAGRPRRVSRAARAGAGERSPPARPAARPLPPPGRLARLALLAPEGHDPLERARGPPPARERPPRVPRGEDAAHLRQVRLGDLRPLGQVPRRDVPRSRRGRGAARRPQADELPRAHAAVRKPAAELPRPSAPLRRVVDAAPQRADRDAPRPAPRPARDAGRRAHLLRARADRGRDLRLPRLRRVPLRPVRDGGAVRALDPAGRTSSGPTRSGTSPRRRSAPRSTSVASRTTSARARARSTARRSTCT